MTRVSSAAFRAAVAAIILCCGVTRIQAQSPAPVRAGTGGNSRAGARAGSRGERRSAQNPFAPVPAPPLPPGMTGSDVNDPRYKLTPGLDDAGEASEGHQAPAAAEKAGSVSTRYRPAR